MKYRRLGRTGVQVSALGFGTMRLPRGKTEADVNEAESIEMIRFAIDQGVNYIDTAYVYHGGNSERIVGSALEGDYRSRVHIATKLPVWMVNETRDCDRLLDEQLTRLRCGHIDFYLLHCLQKKSWEKMRDIGVLEWAEKARSEGRIRHLGFSFHDDYDTFERIVDEHDWSVCQIQYNYLCEEVQAGTRGLQYAASKDLGVIVMEPLFGGTLACPPRPAQEIWDSVLDRYRPVDLALQWLWNRPEVATVLSGMNELSQVQENIASANRSGVGTLDTDAIELIRRVRDAYMQLSPIPCTKCGYCLPCPHGVNVPQNLELFNHATVLKGNSAVLCKNLYFAMPENERAAGCVECGTCEDHCPQHISIRQMLKEVDKTFR